MASTWLWRGRDEELIRVDVKNEVASGIVKTIKPAHLARSNNDVSLGFIPSISDAVIVDHLNVQIDLKKYEHIWLLNKGAASAIRLSDEDKRRLWKRAGLGNSERALLSERVYCVSVVNLEPYSITRMESSGFRVIEEDILSRTSGSIVNFSINNWPLDAALRRVARTAVRALYTIGIDIGEAIIALGGDGRVTVRAVWPMFRDASQGAEAIERFAAWYAAASELYEDRSRILIGADPEFVLLMPSGKVAPASRFFGAGASGAAGADAMLVGRRLLYPVAELRPAPAESPAALAANVRRLLARAAVKISDPTLRWVAGAMPVPGLALGGHIHISGAPLTGRLLRMLDSCVAYPLALVEDPAGRGRRPRYGALGDFRPQPHGGFEYRTLPSWLVSPAAAKGAFALALLCAREALQIGRIPAQEERYAEAYYSGDRTELASCLDMIASAISATESYAALAAYIEPLFEAARRGKTWDESVDIRTKWRLPIS
ncbi:hypothetical protein I6N90_08310 [Paenibacillus sp. GSMTC-2017]|uniref:putative amidoligase domain-containing protein n=1 Tax=Paenibacillus sp. GSMTC-2017 TaxID=2794350 RepID=UPI0018D81B12|nr:hypothetical protein [Paenibacillus sp. GSMTC-2017]MBH5317805.1 hypothetical protein [Paenibacillus sp. GSMTC-2017]